MDRQELDSLRSVAELQAYQKEVRGRITELDSEFAGLPFPDETREEYADLRSDDEEIDKRVTELQARENYVRRVTDESGNREETWNPSPRSNARDENIYDLTTVRRSYTDPSVEGRELRDRALKAVERARIVHPIVSKEDAQRQIERLLHRDSEDGRFARYILATGNPTYKRAFPKLIVPNGLAMLSREEQSAVNTAMYAERALNLTGAQGGFAVPFELDPTILATSNGVVNPIRQIANVKQITVDEWRGITSAGVTAAYAAEATETTDNAPTLVQPTISAEKAQVFIPFSIEVGMDWNGLQEEMSGLIQDAKDTLEANKFVVGTGTNEPFGVAVGTTNTVAAAAAGAFTLANLYALRAALPPRYRPNASFIGDLLIADKIRQFDTVGSSASIWQDSLQLDTPPRLLGKAFYEASEMPDVTTSGVKFLIVGDFSRYVIADRIGLTVDLIPHLMGANRRPTGERGIYGYWRNGAKVVDANAFRALLGQT
jgi:HK97 family phage major capsid protein